MKQREQVRGQSRKAALCGMLAALSVAILVLGGLIPLATFTCPFLAMLCLIPVLCDYGAGTAFLLYTAAAVLAILLCPDKEVALLYTFLSWYPCVRARLERVPRPVRWVVKCALFTGAMLVMYGLILFLVRLDAVADEFALYTAAMEVALLVMGNVTFLIFDRVLARMSVLYQTKRKNSKPPENQRF